MEDAILIFSKAAEPGNVKTRLRPVLTDSECLSLHLALLQDTIAKCKSLSADSALYLSSSAGLPFPVPIPIHFQQGQDLGDRMYNAFSETLRNYSHVAILGTDSPTVPPESISRALQGLHDHEIVLGPSEDGGYYLIALREAIREIFVGIPWGTSEVMEKTMQVLMHHKVLLLESAYDVDAPADLIRLRTEVLSSNAWYLDHTRQWFLQHPLTGI